jgi:large subunit ribosomal protein L25
MREVSITALKRDDLGKGPARRERMAGRIPAIVYGPEVKPYTVSVEEKEMRRALKAAGSISVFDLEIDGQQQKVIMREIQRDPVTTKITHIDFHAISMNKPISISVPVKFTGIPVGVKTDGGIMQVTMRELEISCLPTDIPDEVVIDVEELGIGDSIHVRNVDIPNVKILSNEQRTIVVIAAPTVIKETVTAEEGEGLEGEEGVEGAEGAEGEAAEGAEEGEKKEEGGESKE